MAKGPAYNICMVNDDETAVYACGNCHQWLVELVIATLNRSTKAINQKLILITRYEIYFQMRVLI